MTYYKQFAEMLGLELGQEFILTTPNGEKANLTTYKIIEDGIYYKSATQDGTHDGLFSASDEILGSLLIGELKAVPKQWKPKFGEQYWSYSLKINRTCCNMFGEFIEDYAMWKSGNCFRTEEEAKTKGKEIMEGLVKEYEEA